MSESTRAPLFSAQRWTELREELDVLQELDSVACEERLRTIAERDANLADSLRGLLAEDRHSLLTRQQGFVEYMGAALGEMPERVGPFRLRERIGAGGMGVIYLAERENADFSQRVAIKLLEGGTAGHTLLAARERRILSTLAHPNITAFVDAGIDHGRAWIAMEYVDGESLLDYCARKELGARERVQLFDQVCAAVAHAHTQLVVHRDLKPSNILVNREGVAKLLDFGIALALDASDESAPATRIFTPEYASPEQLRGERATAASDVYALGLLLYELVCQRRLPILNRATREAEWSTSELARTLRPETRSGEALAAAAEADQRRHASQLLRGDLGRIIAHALNPEPAQRYASVALMREDLTRWREFRPLTIGRPGFLYTARRFSRRHRVGVSLAAVALIALIGLAAEALRQAHAKAEEAARAQAALHRSQATLDFVSSMFLAADPYVGKGLKVTADELLTATRARIDAELGDEPEVAASVLRQIGSIYVGVGENAAAREVLIKALDYNARSAQPSAQFDAFIRTRVAYDDFATSRNPNDMRQLQSSVQQLRALGTAAELELGQALTMLANAQYTQGHADEAVTTYAESVALLEKFRDKEAEEYLGAVTGYTDLLASLDRNEEAVALLDKALTHPYLDRPEGATRRQALLGTRARGLAGLYRYVEAESAMTEVIGYVVAQLGKEHSHTRYWRYRRIQILDWMGRLDEAHKEIETLLATPPSGDEQAVARVAHLVERYNIDVQRRAGPLAEPRQSARAAACGEHGVAMFCAKVRLLDARAALHSGSMAEAHGALDECGRDEAIRTTPLMSAQLTLLRAELARRESRFAEADTLIAQARANPGANEEFLAAVDVEQGYLALARGERAQALELLDRGRAYIVEPLAELTPEVHEIDAAIAQARRQ